jgi:hypothetical protein
MEPAVGEAAELPLEEPSTVQPEESASFVETFEPAAVEVEAAHVSQEAELAAQPEEEAVSFTETVEPCAPAEFEVAAPEVEPEFFAAPAEETVALLIQ